MAEKEVKGIRNFLESFKKDMDVRLNGLTKQLSGMQARAENVLGKVSTTVQDRPLVAVGIAFVLGLVLGVVLSRSRRD